MSSSIWLTIIITIILTCIIFFVILFYMRCGSIGNIGIRCLRDMFNDWLFVYSGETKNNIQESKPIVPQPVVPQPVVAPPYAPIIDKPINTPINTPSGELSMEEQLKAAGFGEDAMSVLFALDDAFEESASAMTFG